MNFSKRRGAAFAAGFLLVLAVVAVAWRVVATSSPPAVRPAVATLVPELPRIDSPQASSCPAQPAVEAQGDRDGRFPFQSDLAGLSATDIGSFILIGKESASAGRPRDAEAALLMACRLAAKLKGSGSVESADAKYPLAWHYAALAQQGPSDPVSAGAELLARAQLLYLDSLTIYQAKFGESHEKSRFAAEGLATVRQTLAHAAALPGTGRPAAAASAAEPAMPAVAGGRPANAPATSSVPRKTELAKAVPPPRPAAVPPARTSPSFDCRRARSIPEKMICSDAELSQLDRELGRVYARARNAASDPAAFRRQQNQEWLRREANCRDRACLLRWYAQRRDQLMREIEGRGPLPATAARS